MDTDLQLTPAELPSYHRTLAGPHRPRWRYDILDLNGRPLNALPVPQDASITADQNADVTRGVTGTLYDPDHLAQVDTSSPADGTLTLDRLLRIQHTVHVPDLNNYTGGLGRDVTATPFYGWLTKADRDGDTIALEAQGLERRAMFGCRPYSVPTGTRVVDAILRILYYLYGERRFDFPANNHARLLQPVTVGGWKDEVAGWPVCRKLASGIDLQLFYSCNGRATLRADPDHPVVDFIIGGPDANVTTEPKGTIDALAVRNRVEGRGPNGLKYSATLDDDDPLSAYNLRRHSVPGEMPEVLSNDAYTTLSKVTSAAKRRLANAKHQTQDSGFTLTPLPHLDVGDLGQIITPDYTTPARVRSFTLPTTGEDMTINRRARLDPNRRAIRA